MNLRGRGVVAYVGDGEAGVGVAALLGVKHLLAEALVERQAVVADLVGVGGEGAAAVVALLGPRGVVEAWLRLVGGRGVSGSARREAQLREQSVCL